MIHEIALTIQIVTSIADKTRRELESAHSGVTQAGTGCADKDYP